MAGQIDSFHMEVAFRESNAERPNPPLGRRLKKRLSALLTPTVVRILGALIFVTCSAAEWYWRVPLSGFLNSRVAHAPGASDTLAMVVRGAPEDRLARLVLACARENNAAECESALLSLAKLSPKRAQVCLQLPEVDALRENAFFDRAAGQVGGGISD